MSTLTSVLGSKGPGHSFEAHGRTYRVSHLTQARKAAFEGWLRQQALTALQSMRDLFSPAEYADERRRLMQELATGRYAFHGELAAQALQTPAGSLAMAAILFDVDEDTMTQLITEHGEQVKELLDLVLVESTPQPKGSTQDPN